MADPDPIGESQPSDALLRRIIGRALRRTRQHQERTLAQVAGAARISLPYLSEVERGRKEVSSEVLAAICAALGLDLAELLAAMLQDVTADRVRPGPWQPVPQRRTVALFEPAPGQYPSPHRRGIEPPSAPGNVVCLAA